MKKQNGSDLVFCAHTSCAPYIVKVYDAAEYARGILLVSHDPKRAADKGMQLARPQHARDEAAVRASRYVGARIVEL